MKRNFVRRGKRKPGNKSFWDKEYKEGAHLALSTDPSEDLEKFARWLFRASGKQYLNPLASVLDLGAGNGRNLIYLAETFGIRGVGYDISNEAIGQAKNASEGMPLVYEARSIAGDITLPDASQTIVLDMMTSHFLHAPEREHLIHEIVRVLKPGGWFFWKTFLLDDDIHAKRMLRDHPAPEAGSYIHPEIGALEHVSTEEEMVDALYGKLDIHKITKSHGHMRRNKPKRRSICVYAQKPLHEVLAQK